MDIYARRSTLYLSFKLCTLSKICPSVAHLFVLQIRICICVKVLVYLITLLDFLSITTVYRFIGNIHWIMSNFFHHL